MKKSFIRIYKKLLLTSLKEREKLLIKVIKIRREKKNFFLNESKTQKKAFCLESKNPRSVYNKFSLSRMNLKRHADFGDINGVKKSS